MKPIMFQTFDQTEPIVPLMKTRCLSPGVSLTGGEMLLTRDH